MDNAMIRRHLKPINPNESGEDCKLRHIDNLQRDKDQNLDEKERKMREIAEKEKGITCEGRSPYFNCLGWCRGKCQFNE